MRIAVESFRGESPRISPRLLPENAAQIALNARLQSGDLESWRQFLLTKTLANAGTVQTLYLLNGAWLSWNAQVDVSRGVIPGDATFRTYLTSPGLYATPRFTTYAMATGGAEPFPVVTRPLGVPAAPGPISAVASANAVPDHDVMDDGSQFGQWIGSGNMTTGNVTQIGAADSATGHPPPSYYMAAAHTNGFWMKRDFGIANCAIAEMTAGFMIKQKTEPGLLGIRIRICNDENGAGPCVSLVFPAGPGSFQLSIDTASSFDTVSAVSAAQSSPPTLGVWYKLHVKVVRTSHVAMQVTAEYMNDDGGVITAVSGNMSALGGGYCALINTNTAESNVPVLMYWDNIHVTGSGALDSPATSVTTSYVYTLVNDLGEMGPPSPPTASVARADQAWIVVTTPTTPPPGTDPAYGIVTKRLYRSVTGSTGTIFVLVDEIPLGQAVYEDKKDDTAIADSDVLMSEDWDLPPDDLQGIIALPNGVMAGFRRNQLCLSAAGYPHAWPVGYRLPTDTDIVAIANIDNTIVIGTKSFLYTATGNSPDSYSMSKPGDPQACVSKRSMMFVPDLGVVYASPDGLMVCGGSAGQVTNASKGFFTKRQWQALQPSSIVSAVHDGVLFFFCSGTVPASGYAFDTTPNGFGLIRLSFHASALHVDPLTDALYTVLDVNTEPTDSNLPLPSTAVAPSTARVYRFDAGGSDMVFVWRGKLNLMAIPTALQVMQVRCASFTNILVRLYGDGALMWEQVLRDMREFTIPALDAHDSFELELMGTSTVRGAQAAEEVEELR